jgi:hypothetical protein
MSAGPDRGTTILRREPVSDLRGRSFAATLIAGVLSKLAGAGVRAAGLLVQATAEQEAKAAKVYIVRDGRGRLVSWR